MCSSLDTFVGFMSKEAALWQTAFVVDWVAQHFASIGLWK